MNEFGIHLMMEMARRVQPGGDWWKPKTAELAREAGQQLAYCLDAPDEIPAGGMYSDEIDGDPLPMLLTVPRGAELGEGR